MVHQTVDRHLRSIIVEPNILSRPLLNRHVLGRMFNQFWAFAFAWANQAMPVAAQHSALRFAGFLSVATGMGALAESERQELDGLKHRVIMAMGRQIADIMENGRQENHPNAADFAVALKWLHDDKSDGAAVGAENPIAMAIEQIRAGRCAGGSIPHLDSNEIATER